MTPLGIKTMTLSQLRSTRKSMLSAQWMLSLQDADPASRTSAAQQLLAVNHAIMTLENAQLADIRDALVANEGAITAGAQDVTAALADLGQVKAVISAVSAFLGIVGKLVSIFEVP